MFNFAEAAAGAIAAGAAMEVADARALLVAVAELLEDAPRRAKMGADALAFHAAHRGAADRLWNWLAPRIAAAIEGGDVSP
jgi:3-deoxy-D-manno-octulosonic-acid transferase